MKIQWPFVTRATFQREVAMARAYRDHEDAQLANIAAHCRLMIYKMDEVTAALKVKTKKAK